MELRFTNHASERMIEQRIDRSSVERIVSAPERIVVGETAAEYDGVADDGRPLRVVVARDPDPPLVITVYVRR